MRKSVLAIIILTTFFISISKAKTIEYYGNLSDSSGNAIADGEYLFKFTIYDNSFDGNPLWQSDRDINLTITDGVFSHTLGTFRPLPDSLSSYDSLWLEIALLSEPFITTRLLLSVNETTEDSNASSIENKDDNKSNDQDIAYPDPSWLYSQFDEASNKINKGKRTSNRAHWGVIFKIGYDFGGDYKTIHGDESATYQIKSGYNYAGEFLHINKQQTHRIGIGMEIQRPRSFKDYKGSFNFLSLYATAKVHFHSNKPKGFFVFVSGKLGHSFLSGDNDYAGYGSIRADLSGGATGAIGIGMIYKTKFIAELLYSIYTGKYNIQRYESNIQYSKIILSIGIVLPE